MTAPSLRDEIAQYIANEYTDRRICDADREQADDILAIITRHTAPLRAAVEAADAMRDEIEGTVDQAKVRDCQGDKCRLPECIACNGDDAYMCPSVWTPRGHIAARYDAARKEIAP